MSGKRGRRILHAVMHMLFNSFFNLSYFVNDANITWLYIEKELNVLSNKSILINLERE